ncbi:MAG: hypothetical protein GY866_01040 [Proteobacteria bacterium]|nr:hypothetical protein [Pseudomonadota bacterium]
MNFKSIFEPIDRVIAQARSYIHEQDIRKNNIAQIEDKVEQIKPELEKRKNELIELIEQIEPNDDFKKRLEGSLVQLDTYLDHVHLIAEKELAREILQEEKQEDDEGKKELRDKYIKLQVARLEEQLKNTNNFFEVADFANEIWADFDLFEEFSRDEFVVQQLVDRMNETNAKNTETRMGRDLRKTLEHIRLNLVKSSAWSDNDVREYQGERDLKLKQLQPVKIPDNRNFMVTMLGGGPEVINKLYEVYALPSRLKLEWLDVEKADMIDNLLRSSPKHDLVVFYSMFPKHGRFVEIKEKLTKNSIRYIDVISFGISKLLKVLEDELIQISFQNQFGGK